MTDIIKFRAPLDLDELERLEREATEATSACWVRTTDRNDGTAQIYSPSRGPLRVVVPVAETEERFGARLFDYIAYFSIVQSEISAIRKFSR